MPSRVLAIGDPSRAADRGQRRGDHGRPAVAARSAAISDLDRVRRARHLVEAGRATCARCAGA
jgi:hypothetical protein